MLKRGISGPTIVLLTAVISIFALGYVIYITVFTDTGSIWNDKAQARSLGTSLAGYAELNEPEENSSFLPQCNDSLDNDNDGWFDTQDPGCVNGTDNDEKYTGSVQCSNELDDDNDDFIDGNDLDCQSSEDDSEDTPY